MTEAAKAITGCVAASGQRYGVNVILDTVHGSAGAKIRQYRMDENPWYGSLKEMPVYRLRQVMNELQLRGFLTVTNDGYAVVKLGEQAIALQAGEVKVEMKLAREEPRGEKKKEVRKKKKAGALTEAEEELFERLRALRMRCV